MLSKNGNRAGTTKDKIVIYHAMTAYQFLECLIDKIYYNRESRGVFLISKFVSNAYPEYLKLVEAGYFDHILVFDFRALANLESVSEFEEKTIQYYDNLLGQVGINIEDCDEVHIAGAHQAFGCYTCLKKIPFYFYEEGAGTLSRKSGLSQFVQKHDPTKNEIAIKYGLYDGNNDLVIEARCVMSAQLPDNIHNKARNYEVVKLMSHLNKNDMDFLLDFFQVPLDIEARDDYYLIMGQQLTRDGVFFTSEERILTYQLLIDYYTTNENVILKPHPADKSPYEDYMNNILIMRSKFPSEFLPFIPNVKFHKAITITSSSVNNLKNFVDSIQALDNGFLNFSFALHRFNLAFQLIKLLITERTTLFHYGIHKQQIHQFVINYVKDERFITKPLELKEIPTNSICIFNNLARYESQKLSKIMEEVDDSVVFIFINQNNDYRFYDLNKPDLLDYMVPIIIKKERLKQNILEDLHDETIYVFSKDSNIRNRLKYFYFRQELPCTGISLEVIPLTEEREEMKLLETKVSAMEHMVREFLETTVVG